MTENAHIRPEEGEPGTFLTPDEQAKLLGFSELLFFAYRDFTGDPDAILRVLGFGRAHHRVLHFVTRKPGLRVADLLELLKITKQSLGRVLRELIDTGYIRQEAGSQDRRERLLYPTEAGVDLARRLSAPQLVRLAKAFEAAGPNAEIVVRRFLEAMANAEDRPQMAKMVSEELDTLKSSGQAAKKSRDGDSDSRLKDSRERAG